MAAALVLLTVGAVLGWLISYLMPGLIRFVTRRGPLDVHVEDDPANIWAGEPPWVGGRYVMPDGDLPDPPGTFCPEWWAWAREAGGVDADETHLRVSLVGSTDVTIVIDGLRAKIHETSQVSGQVAQCAVGGPEGAPRHFQIRLDDFASPIVTYVDEFGEYASTPALRVAKGEVELLHIVALAEDARVEWTGELLAVVNGKRQVIPLRPSHGRHFVTSATEGLNARCWMGEGWSDPEELVR